MSYDDDWSKSVWFILFKWTVFLIIPVFGSVLVMFLKGQKMRNLSKADMSNAMEGGIDTYFLVVMTLTMDNE